MEQNSEEKSTHDDVRKKEERSPSTSLKSRKLARRVVKRGCNKEEKKRELGEKNTQLSKLIKKGMEKTSPGGGTLEVLKGIIRLRKGGGKRGLRSQHRKWGIKPFRGAGKPEEPDLRKGKKIRGWFK